MSSFEDATIPAFELSGLLIAWFPLTLVAFWFIYRDVGGWLALNDRKPMPV